MIVQEDLEKIRNLTVELAQGQTKLDELQQFIQSLSSAPENTVELVVFNKRINVPREFHGRLIDILVDVNANQRKKNEEMEYKLIEIFRSFVPCYDDK